MLIKVEKELSLNVVPENNDKKWKMDKIIGILNSKAHILGIKQANFRVHGRNLIKLQLNSILF